MLSEEDKKKSTEKSEESTTKSDSDEPKSISDAVDASSAAQTAEAAETAAKQAIQAAEAARSAAEAAADAEYQAAAAQVEESDSSEKWTNKRRGERIFRRELGEPEFFQQKKDRIPLKPVRTPEEEQEITKRVQIPSDQTPQYDPVHVLSPEFNGASNYESGINDLEKEITEKLNRLSSNPDANPMEISQAHEDLKTLDNLYENYHLGMSAFRTAKNKKSRVRA